MQAVDESKCLFHHGILGQQWYKKNGPPYPLSGSAHSASEKKAGWKDSLNKNKQRKEAKRNRRSSLQDRRTMSDEDLREQIKRMQLEKQYKQMIQEDLSPGRQVVNQILTDAGKQVATSALKGAMSYAGKYAVQQITGNEQLANAMFNNVRLKSEAQKVINQVKNNKQQNSNKKK